MYLEKEINFDRAEHGKKSLKDKKDDDDNNNGKSLSGGTFKEEKCSTSDPESGWFHKGEHKQVFAYSVETACDKHGWILGYTVNKGNYDLCKKRKETIERLFGTAKEHHGFRYTQMAGKAKMEMKVGLTLAPKS